MADSTKGRIIGIGGIFFKSENPEELKSWYEKKPLVIQAILQINREVPSAVWLRSRDILWAC